MATATVTGRATGWAHVSAPWAWRLGWDWAMPCPVTGWPSAAWAWVWHAGGGSAPGRAGWGWAKTSCPCRVTVLPPACWAAPPARRAPARRGTAGRVPRSRYAAALFSWSRGRPGCLAGVKLGRYVDARAEEGRGDPGPDVAADFELLAGQRPRHHAHRVRVGLDFLDAHHGRPVEHHLAQRVVVVGVIADLLEYLGDPADVDAGRHRYVDHRPGPVPGHVGDLHDLAVRRGDDLAAHRADPGDPQRDVLDRAGDLLRHAGDPNADDVAEAVLPLPGEEEPGADVLDEALQAEPDRGGQQGSGRDERGQLHAEALHDQHGGHQVDDRERRPGDHLGEQVTVLGGLGADQLVALVRVRVDPSRDLAAQPLRQAGQQDRAENQQDDLEQAGARPHAEVSEWSEVSEWWSRAGHCVALPVRSAHHSTAASWPIRSA